MAAGVVGVMNRVFAAVADTHGSQLSGEQNS